MSSLTSKHTYIGFVHVATLEIMAKFEDRNIHTHNYVYI